MGVKFDQQKTKHHLIHISINLGIVLLCMSYLQNGKRLLKLGKLWESMIIPIVLMGEILKLSLARYFVFKDKATSGNKHKKKGFMSFGDAARALSIQISCVIFYGLVCIILGAPVLYSYEETFVLAILLTLMTVSPAVFLVGASGTLQAAFCEVSEYLTKSEETALELIKMNSIGAILGAWGGSVVAPLDWDREWQAYPIPNIIGALLGSGIINIYMCTKALISTGRTYYYKNRF